jgi:hypothetical protein
MGSAGTGAIEKEEKGRGAREKEIAPPLETASTGTAERGMK